MIDLKHLKKHLLEEARHLALPICHGDEVLGQLVPVGPWIIGEPRLVEEIAQWRGAAMRMFLTQFDSTPQKTLAYLEDHSIEDPNRILFMIEVEGQFLGHVGLASVNGISAEVDNLIRGVIGGHPKLMQASERTLVEWAFGELKLRSLFLRILSYNMLAKDLHESLGFVTTERLPLRRELAGDVALLIVCRLEECGVPYTCDIMVLERAAYTAL